MAAIATPWSVLPHQAPEHVSSSIVTVTGNLRMPFCWLQRRMTVARLCDGRLVIYSAMSLDDAGMQKLEELGTPAYLIVPSRYHCRDALPWKQRYPGLTVVAPSGSRARVDRVVPVDTSTPTFPDDGVRFVEVAGTEGVESALEIREDGRLTLVLNDIVGNLPPSDGWVLRAMGFAHERPRIPRAAKLTLVKDTRALRAQLEAWAEQPVERLFVSHGRPVSADVPELLRELAASL